MDVRRIQGVIKEYDWGNTSFLPELLGLKKDGRSKAEYWMGTHPSGDATVLPEGEPLSSFLRSHAETYLGSAHLARYGATLPLLFKVLAIEKPLSIQCHPTTEQAEAGWKKETSLRFRDKDSSHWDYKDATRKAEVAFALTPMTAMCGFRPYEEIVASLELLMPSSFARCFQLSSDGTQGIRQIFQTLYTMDKETLSLCIKEYLASLVKHEEMPLSSADGRFLESKGIVMACKDAYPSDPGLFSPFLLHVLHLEEGEALYLKPDTLHAYVLGDCIELMSASDNVLRGGLTHKKVDVPELLSLMSTEGGAMEKCREVREPDGRIRVMTPTPEFALYEMRTGSYRIHHDKVELLLSLDGDAVLEKDGEKVTLEKGACVLKGASVSDYRLDVNGLLFSATLGD